MEIPAVLGRGFVSSIKLRVGCWRFMNGMGREGSSSSCFTSATDHYSICYGRMAFSLQAGDHNQLVNAKLHSSCARLRGGAGCCGICQASRATPGTGCEFADVSVHWMRASSRLLRGARASIPTTMAKKAIQKDQIVKLIVGAGQASPSPPVGPALGSKGVKSMDFCKVSASPSPSKRTPTKSSPLSHRSHPRRTKAPRTALPLATQLTPPFSLAGV